MRDSGVGLVRRVLGVRRRALRTSHRQRLDEQVQHIERLRLVSELQGDIEHELSVAAVQLMAGPEIEPVSDSIERACSQLRLLRQLSVAGFRAERDRCRPDDLYRAVASWTETLRRAGFDVSFGIPVPSQRLAGSLQVTLVQALEVLGRLVLDRAEPGSRCALAIRSTGCTELQLTTIVPAQRCRLLDRAPGLAAVRHRSALVGGRFEFRTEALDCPRGTTGSGLLRCVVTLLLPHPLSADL